MILCGMEIAREHDENALRTAPQAKREGPKLFITSDLQDSSGECHPTPSSSGQQFPAGSPQLLP